MLKYLHRFVLLGCFGVLSACTEPVGSFPALIKPIDQNTDKDGASDAEPAQEVEEPIEETPSEEEITEPEPPKEDIKVEVDMNQGVTPAEAANVSKEEVAVAKAEPTTKSKLLGESVGSLGLLERAGIWVRTPLVKEEKKGRIVHKATGKSANVILIPMDAEPGAGSQISLAAMQVLDIPITDLPVIEVYEL